MSKRILSIRFRYQRHGDLAAVLGVALLVSALLLGLGLGARRAAAQRAERPSSAPAAPASQAPPAPLRQYYLTEGGYNGNKADGTDGEGAGNCASGYHFASLWEIFDPSNLRYNINLGKSKGDSGMGPPSASTGWIRTGYNDNTGTTPGMANCNGWDSISGAGTLLNLPGNWSDPDQQDIHVWNADTKACTIEASIWCVADEPDAPGACSRPKPVVCGDQVTGDSSQLPSHIAAYSCQATRDESGPDTVYALSLPTGDTYTVTATISGTIGVDLDVFFLDSGDCYSGTCQTPSAYGDTTVTLTDLDPGSYYIAVDGYDGDAGAYTLTIGCSKTFIFLPLVVK